jgi:outer membrane immunogenic protein
MNKLFITGIALAAATTSAMAAELPFPAPAPVYGVVAPPPILRFSWTGCYLGGHFGGSFVDNRFSGPFVDLALPDTTVPGVPGAPNPRTFAISEASIDQNTTGFLIGGQIGCNLQFARRWVIGAEFDASWASQQGNRTTTETESQTFLGTGQASTITTAVSSTGMVTSRTDFIPTLTARVGYTFGNFGQGLIYAKGGAAWARDTFQFTGQVLTTGCGTALLITPAPPQPPFFTCLITNPTIVQSFNFGASETRVGWTLGAGLEWAMFGNWSVKLEYDYLDLGSRTLTLTDSVLPAVSPSISVRINEVKFGINYRFGDPLPVL